MNSNFNNGCVWWQAFSQKQIAVWRYIEWFQNKVLLESTVKSISTLKYPFSIHFHPVMYSKTHFVLPRYFVCVCDINRKEFGLAKKDSNNVDKKYKFIQNDRALCIFDWQSNENLFDWMHNFRHYSQVWDQNLNKISRIYLACWNYFHFRKRHNFRTAKSSFQCLFKLKLNLFLPFENVVGLLPVRETFTLFYYYYCLTVYSYSHRAAFYNSTNFKYFNVIHQQYYTSSHD